MTMLKHALVLVFGMMSFTGLYAANYYFIGNSTDSLQDVGNYRMNGRTGEAATQLPGADDCIYFNNKYDTLRTYELSAADTAFVAGRGLRALKVQDAVVAFNVDTDLEFSCAINGSDSNDAFRRTGKIIKKGEGKMTLSSYGVFTATGGTDDYMMKEIEVAEGTLLLPQNPASGAAQMYSAILTVNEGASLQLPASYVTTVHCDGLQGAGSVVFGGTGNISIYVSKHAGAALDFSGTVTGNNIFCKINDGAQQTFSGVKNDFSRRIDVGTGAVLGFSTGSTAKDGEQSLGTNGETVFDSETSTLKYVGEGQQTFSKVITAKYGMTYDGGPNGGLVLGSSGYPWRRASADSNPGVARLILQGDGSAENEMRCHVYNKIGDATIMSVPLTLVKRGAGTWRLFGSANYEIDSTVAVDAGTLRFNSLTPAGTKCSLGWGTHLYDPDYSVAGVIDERKKVGYHIRLGGGTTAGVLEYVGTDEVDNDTRVIALNGSGTLRNASEAAFTHRGVITTSEGEHVLTLDRAAASGEFTVGDITNSLGTLSVVKTGSGDVHLDGRLDFNGDLSVREGRLVAGNTVYTYFRFTVKDNMADEISKAGFNHVLRLTEFALYDADGNRLNTGLEQMPADAASLGEGQFRYVRGRDYNSTDIPANLFDDSASTHWVGMGGYEKFDPADSSKDFIMEIRLPADSPRAVSFDYITDYNGPTEKGVAVEGTDYSWYVAAPRIYVLEGSVDGENWEELYSESDAFTGMLLRSKKWASSGGTEAFEAEAVRKVSEGKGFAFKPSSEKLFETLSNIKTVSVASSATLDLRGNVAPIKGLVIDASTGIGEVIGGTLADTGTVTLVNVGEGQEFVPGSLKGIEGYLKLADRNAWTFVVKGTDGEVIPHRTVSLNADGFLLVRGPGLRLTVR